MKAQLWKRKGKTSSSALKRIKTFKPKLAKVNSSEPTLMVVEAILEVSDVMPKPTLPPTVLIPWLFPSSAIAQDAKKATPSSKPLADDLEGVFS